MSYTEQEFNEAMASLDGLEYSNAREGYIYILSRFAHAAGVFVTVGVEVIVKVGL